MTPAPSRMPAGTIRLLMPVLEAVYLEATCVVDHAIVFDMEWADVDDQGRAAVTAPPKDDEFNTAKPSRRIHAPPMLLKHHRECSIRSRGNAPALRVPRRLPEMHKVRCSLVVVAQLLGYTIAKDTATVNAPPSGQHKISSRRSRPNHEQRGRCRCGSWASVSSLHLLPEIDA